jgi:hypothetical protein
MDGIFICFETEEEEKKRETPHIALFFLKACIKSRLLLNSRGLLGIYIQNFFRKNVEKRRFKT